MMSTTKIVSTIAVLFAVSGSFFLGFGRCGGYAILNLTIGLGILGAACLALLLHWRDFKVRKTAQKTTFGASLKLIGFTMALLIFLQVANAVGWVTYISPKSLEEAFMEFKNALIGEQCG